jgi:hypothetical protein
MRLTSQRGVSLLLLIIATTVFAGVAIGIVTLLRPRYESYPYQVQSYQASALAQAGAEFAVRYARENADGSGNYTIALANLLASTNGRFNLGDGAFQLTYVAVNPCTDELHSRGCSTRFSADGTCPGATREVRLQPLGAAVGTTYGGAAPGPFAGVSMSSPISRIHYDYGFGNYQGSTLGFSFCDFTRVYSLGNMSIPHGNIEGEYGPAWSSGGTGGYWATIAATRDGANKQVTLGRLGFTGLSGANWIWDTACGPCLGPKIGGQNTFAGQLLPAWDRTTNPVPLPSEVFQIVPVQHNGYAHTRWPTSGYSAFQQYPQDRPHTGVQCTMAQSWPACTSSDCNCCLASSASRSDSLSAPTCDGSLPVCCEPPPGNSTNYENCIDTTASGGWPWASRTETTCSGEVSGGGSTGLTAVMIQVPGGGNLVLETLGDVTPPVTFYLQFPYSPCDVQGCENGTNCRTKYPPQYITWVFTVTN